MTARRRGQARLVSGFSSVACRPPAVCRLQSASVWRTKSLPSRVTRDRSHPRRAFSATQQQKAVHGKLTHMWGGLNRATKHMLSSRSRSRRKSCPCARPKQIAT